MLFELFIDFFAKLLFTHIPFLLLYAIVDIETTGRFAGANGITEIAVITHDGQKIVDTFSSLVNPGVTILPFVSRLTGISNEMLKNAPRFEEIAKTIWELTNDAVFVAHSVNFDYSFLREEFKVLGPDFKRKKLCTVRLSRSVFPGLASYSLGAICSHHNIAINNRHRALGDALATVMLFEKCLSNNGEIHIYRMLKRNSNESVLPTQLTPDKFNSLPEKCGVYYFHDKKGKIIYIGKEINIKKRIYSHFKSSGRNKLSFIDAIAVISFQLCGTELIALLFESQEIKKHFPIYNAAQKFDKGLYVITDYINQKGVRQLVITKSNHSINILKAFGSFDEAREAMNLLKENFELCPKFCSIQSTSGHCFDLHLKKCKGVCDEKESVKKYNKRVEKAIASIQEPGSRLIIGDGREDGEKSVVIIEEGFYRGYGFFEKGKEPQSLEQAKTMIFASKHTGNIHRILESVRFAVSNS